MPGSLPHGERPQQPQKPDQQHDELIPDVGAETETVKLPSKLLRQMDSESAEDVVTVTQPEVTEAQVFYA